MTDHLVSRRGGRGGGLYSGGIRNTVADKNSVAFTMLNKPEDLFI